MLSPQKAADRAGVSRKTIMDQIVAGKLPAHRNNQNRWQIQPEDLERWLEGRPRKATSAAPTDMPAATIRLEEQLKAALKEAATYQSLLEDERRERREERDAARAERQRLLEEARGEREKLLEELAIARQRRGLWGLLSGR